MRRQEDRRVPGSRVRFAEAINLDSENQGQREESQLQRIRPNVGGQSALLRGSSSEEGEEAGET